MEKDDSNMNGRRDNAAAAGVVDSSTASSSSSPPSRSVRPGAKSLMNLFELPPPPPPPTERDDNYGSSSGSNRIHSADYVPPPSSRGSSSTASGAGTTAASSVRFQKNPRAVSESAVGRRGGTTPPVGASAATGLMNLFEPPPPTPPSPSSGGAAAAAAGTSAAAAATEKPSVRISHLTTTAGVGTFNKRLDDEPAGAFTPKTKKKELMTRKQLERMSTVTTGNRTTTRSSPQKQSQQQPSPLYDQQNYDADETSLLLQKSWIPSADDDDSSAMISPRSDNNDNNGYAESYEAPLNDLFQPRPAYVPKTAAYAAGGVAGAGATRELVTDDDNNKDIIYQTKEPKRFYQLLPKFTLPDADTVSSTLIGSFTFLLYHIVFCLAQASAITRPNSEVSILGPMAKTAALGIIFTGPLYIIALGAEIPALYPCTDLFLAPFLANLAEIVDTKLYELGEEANDDVFLATFTCLSCIGFALSGLFCVLGSEFKLANLGVFLPYSVLCGFFTAVGIVMWMLAFNVDTNGLKIQDVIKSGDPDLILNCFLHHLPSLTVGIMMHIWGPKKPYYVTLILLSTVGLSYGIMGIMGVSLSDAQELGWFWTKEELRFGNGGEQVGFKRWSPPAPFGIINAIFSGKVNTTALIAGLPTATALAFIYLLRCSLHAAALKKNIPNLVRKSPKDNWISIRFSTMGGELLGHGHGGSTTNVSPSKSMMITPGGVNGDANSSIATSTRENKSKKQVTMLKILRWYGNSQLFASLVGGFGCVPTVAAQTTLFNLGAEKVIPQYGSITLLLIFYLTDFDLVSYIPKPAFSSLLVLAFLDIMITWCFKSFQKTKNKGEWSVVPIIVILSFVVGMLASVALGIAFSTFIFVAAFYRTGVVRYIANGLIIRSTIERNFHDADWLDLNGDLIQVLVLQNYLFFGNASSCLEYITSMFEEPTENYDLDFPLPPIPKYLIIDLTMVTGMDTSAVDVFAEIITICKSFQCKVYMAGLSPNLKSILSHGGVTDIRNRYLNYFHDLDSGLGKAEDNLLNVLGRVQEREAETAGLRKRDRIMSDDDDGFRFALRQIDEQHGVDFAPGLVGLQRFTTPLELKPGATLFEDEGGTIGDSERGLFFIEHGLMRVERDPSYTVTRTGSSPSLRRKSVFAAPRVDAEGGSISQLKARSATIGMESAVLKGTAATNQRGGVDRGAHNFRLARFGPGWVVGTIEGCTGMRNPGIHKALTECRLHHLPYSSIQEIERTNPALILRLFKMISHLMARRQEVTIEQLATLHAIMASPAPTKPVSRTTMAAILNAMKYH